MLWSIHTAMRFRMARRLASLPRASIVILVCAVSASAGANEWFASTPPSDKTRAPIVGDRGDSACSADVDCLQQGDCFAGQCIGGGCSYTQIANCVPCEPTPLCPPVEAVFVMDTSGSMVDQAQALCSQINTMVSILSDVGITMRPTILGITESPGGPFDCLSASVLGRFGVSIPGDSGACPFAAQSSARESWGPATAIVADRFPWPVGALRLIVPMADEGPCNGNQPDGCNDPGDDRRSIENAVQVAAANNVIVSPIIGTGSDLCVLRLAQDLAQATGGVTVIASKPSATLAAAIERIVRRACGSDNACDDDDVCTRNDQCQNLACAGEPIPGCSVCALPRDCDDDDACTTDSCGKLGVCLHSPIDGCISCRTNASCTDRNACTHDACIQGRCDFESEAPIGSCCDPATGVLTPVDDANACTIDECRILTGDVVHVPTPPGGSCSDGDACTLGDQCDSGGMCVGSDRNNVVCTSNSDCEPSICNPNTGRCDCGASPLLYLEVLPPIARTSCYQNQEVLEVQVSVGYTNALLSGGQFVIQYDPTALDFVEARPGADVDPTSPFDAEIFQSVNVTAGIVQYVAGLAPGGSPRRGPAVLAVLLFRVAVACETAELCFRDWEGRRTMVTDASARPIDLRRQCSRGLILDDGAPRLTCPTSRILNAHPGKVSAVTNWIPALATDACDDVAISCSAVHELGAGIDHLIARGGRMPQGTSQFSCEAVDGCDAVATCEWSVKVLDENAVEVSVQISPTMARGPLSRCIEFELYSNCVEEPVIVRKVINFGAPFDLPGRANFITFSAPPGDYQCITARDPRHTLRATADLSSDGTKYSARFVGDPVFGGNWLISGNLNGDRIIDVLDYGIFISQYLQRAEPGTSCGAASPHADINGDGVVDQFDFSFISRNYLKDDKHTCCPATVAGQSDAVQSISVIALASLGMQDLIVADLNVDGVLDALDMFEFLKGVRIWPALAAEAGATPALRQTRRMLAPRSSAESPNAALPR